VVKIADLIKNLNMVMEPFPKRVPIIFSVDSSVPPEFIGDDMKIFRSASNFLTNACAKTDSGSIRLRIFKRVNPENGEDELMFECEDTGPGVDVSKYAYLFKPVFSDPSLPAGAQRTNSEAVADSSRSRGLGLYSVATQIESMGGKYGFRPREASFEHEGTGSVFWFSIPVVLPSEIIPGDRPREVGPAVPNGSATEIPGKSASLPDGVARRLQSLLGMEVPSFVRFKRSDNSLNKLSSEEALVAYAAKRSPSSESMRNETFSLQSIPARKTQALVIEDSVVVRKNLARVLSKLGFEVTQAVNGMEGLKELKSSLFDLVLCDFLMPIMDGLDCIQQYRQWEGVNRPFFKQYIIGISAHANDKDIDQGFKVGMNGFRSKPLTYQDVEELQRGRAFKRARSELDKLGHEMEVLKRRKLEPRPMNSSVSLSNLANNVKVCLVIESSPSISKLAEITSKTIGWTIVPVTDMDSAVRLLKMRNWDAVLVDGDFPGFSHSISLFREWEKRHRVNRQNNIMLLSASFVAPGANDTFQVPTGFDGALAKPIDLDSLQHFFRDSKTSWEIVSR
jgi:CheY-like chemotaxis protein